VRFADFLHLGNRAATSNQGGLMNTRFTSSSPPPPGRPAWPQWCLPRPRLLLTPALAAEGKAASLIASPLRDADADIKVLASNVKTVTTSLRASSTEEDFRLSRARCVRAGC
jgi:hypothetical protein